MIDIKTISLFLISTIIFIPVTVKAKDQWHHTLCASKENSERPACRYISDLSLLSTLRPNFESLNSAKIVFAFGNDECLASSPVYADKKNKTNNLYKFIANPGIPLQRDMQAYCAYRDQLDRAYLLYREVSFKGYPEYKLRIFALYAVKDQVGNFFRNKPVEDSKFDGHRHEWEHAAVWLKNGVPQFVSVTQHKKLISRPVDQVPHLYNQKNTFALKYIRGSIPEWALDQLNGTGSHYPDFAGGERKNGELLATNKDPSPNGKWFGEENFNYIDYDKVPKNFKEIIEKRTNWGETVPRINDVQYFLDQKPDGWFTPPLVPNTTTPLLVPIIKTQP